MKRILLILFFSSSLIQIQAQCEAVAKELWDIIQHENYEAFDKHIMSVEQQRKILHWPKSKEGDNIIKKTIAQLKTELIASAKKVRLELTKQGFDIKNTSYKQCEFKEKNILTVVVSNVKKEYSFTVETLTLDKMYLMYPINKTYAKLPDFQVTKEDNANTTIHINGEVFKPAEANYFHKGEGLDLVTTKCLKTQKDRNKKIIFQEAMEDKNDHLILIFISVSETELTTYKVNLNKKTCVKG